MNKENIGLVFLTLGVLIVLAAIFLLIMGVAFLTVNIGEDSPEENRTTGIAVTAFCGTPLLIIGVVFLFLWYYFSKKAQPLKDLVPILKGYRRIKISEVAMKISKDEKLTESLILNCINDGSIKGYIDFRNKEFVVDPSELKSPQQMVAEYLCRRCGQPLSYIERYKRMYCFNCKEYV